MTRRIARAVVWIVWGIVVDLCEAATCFIAIGAVTVLLGLVLPTGVAFTIALLGVCTLFGYRRAQLIDKRRRDLP